MYRCIFFILLLAGGKWAAASQTPPILADEAIRQMLSTRIDLQKQATGIVIGVIDAKGSHIISYGTTG
jgi:D-alanyl-D-alanine-carboxypeptidase/D-alanyl-D-alanine-endopeptidase